MRSAMADGLASVPASVRIRRHYNGQQERDGKGFPGLKVERQTLPTLISKHLSQKSVSMRRRVAVRFT
jgi:hypothetical protein